MDNESYATNHKQTYYSECYGQQVISKAAKTCTLVHYAFSQCHSEAFLFHVEAKKNDVPVVKMLIECIKELERSLFHISKVLEFVDETTSILQLHL